MTVLFPDTLQHACELLSENPDLKPIAGGTDVMVHWPTNRDALDASYLDLSALDELRFVRWSDSELALGALTTYWDTIQDGEIGRVFPLLIEAARQVGAIQIQTRGTWAGNIANASPAADGVPVLMAYGASVEVESASGTQEIQLSEFYSGYKQMRLRGDQLIKAIHLPRCSYDFERFVKVGSRRAQAITKVGVALTRRVSGDSDSAEWRVVANSVSATVCRCPTVEAFLREERVARSPEDLLSAIRSDVAPIDDIRSTAEYRERVLANVLYSELRDACPFFG
jgi:CO/xanthine dehydrogenase FAD-binding subunit